MAIIIYGNKITAPIGISVPEMADVQMGDNAIESTKIGIEVRSHAADVLKSLALPPDTPTENLILVLQTIAKIPNATPDIAAQVVRGSLFAQYLPTVADWAEIGSVLLEAAKSFFGP